MDSVTLASEALKLSASERAQLIDALWRSLDPADQASVDQAWLRESHDRLEAYRHGEIQAIDGEAALNTIENELPLRHHLFGGGSSPRGGVGHALAPTSEILA